MSARRSIPVALSALVWALTGCDASPETPAASTERVPLRTEELTSGSCQSTEQDPCGGRSTGLCYCDERCLDYGDCCPDATTECLGPQAAAVFIDQGLNAPESVVFDHQTGSYFVSNLAHDILQTSPDNPPPENHGYLSRHGIDGSVTTERFVTGLTSPKGLAVAGSVVYVADQALVLGFDTTTGEEAARYTDAEVGLFNDISVAPDGSLYVTDTVNPGLYRIVPEGGQVEVVVRSELFEFTNGVAVGSDAVYVATTGLLPSETSPGTFGRVFAVDPQQGSVEEIGPLQGKWDGIAVLPSGWLAVNDFMTGQLHGLEPSTGATALLLESPIEGDGFTPVGLADMSVAGSRVLLPSMFTNQILSYTPTIEQ